jgi:hypothetical protein
LAWFAGSTGNHVFDRPLFSPAIYQVKTMPIDSRKRAYRTDLLLAAAMVVAGVAISGVSLTELSAGNPQFAQATPPLQSTPGAETKPSVPAEPVTTGQRPSEIPPQPAHPDAQAQKAGATPALPQAPAEKIAAPIQEK